MAQLKGIGYNNFKVFSTAQYFEFAPITILTGKNSSGKSTIINGLKLLSENFIDLEPKQGNSHNFSNIWSIFSNSFDVKRIAERYGSLEQFVNFNSKEKVFSFSFKTIPELFLSEFEYIFHVAVEDNILKSGKLNKIEIRDLVRKKTILECCESKSKYYGSGKPVYKVKIDLNTIYDHLISSINFSYTFNSLVERYKKSVDLKEKDHIRNQLDTNYKGLFSWLGDGIALYPSSMKQEIVFINENELEALVEDLKNGETCYNLHWYLDHFHDQRSNEESHDTKLKGLSLDGDNRPGSLRHSLNKVLSELEWHIDYDLNFSETLPFNLNRYIERYLVGIPINSQEHLHEEITESFDVSGLISSNNMAIKDFFRDLLERIYNRNDHWDSELELTFLDQFFHGTFILNLLKELTNQISNVKKVFFVDAMRLIPKRTYSINTQDLISSQIYNLFRLNSKQFGESMNFIKKWVVEFEIADTIEFEKNPHSDIVEIFLINKGKKILLADYGFGVSQILPLVLSTVPHLNPAEIIFNSTEEYLVKVVCIEEPENSLHPALQSKLADMFIEAVNLFNVQLILETHSEYLIRKLQYLTAKGKIKPESTIIHYVYHPDDVPKGECQVKKIKINRDGSLSDNFGEGFFDEATNWKFELLKLNNSQNN